jgi:plastocyanin
VDAGPGRRRDAAVVDHLDPSLRKREAAVRNRKSIVVVAALLSGGALLASARSQAESNGSSSHNELEETRRENRRLREQVQTLRAALSDAAEMDRQRVALINKALKAGGGSSGDSKERAEESRAARAAAASVPSAAPPVAPSLPPALPKRRTAEASTGTVRGKVDMPRGEPVAYVYVENVFAPAVKAERVRIEQVRKQFMPPWAVIQKGTTVEFPNTDSVYHNVFSQSSGNSFDLGLYNSTAAAKDHTFNEAGSVDIFCNIHPQMAASILVVPNRHFAKVKPDGSFEIDDVPAGKRKVVAWAPGSRMHVQWVELNGGEVADLGFRLDQKLPGHKNKDGQAYGSYQ